MPSKNDTRHKQIGSRYRAISRYAMLLHRVNNPVGRSSSYNGVEVRIEREAFVEWFMANDFVGCSVDRIDPDGHYEAGNIQLISTKLNAIKDKIKAKDGMCECYACKKIKPLVSFVRDSRRSTGYSTICLVCERQRNNARYHQSRLICA